MILMLSFISLVLLPPFFYAVGAVLACRLLRRSTASPTLLDTLLVGGFMVAGGTLASQGIRGGRASLLWATCCIATGMLLQMVQPRPAERRPLPQ